MKYTNFLFIISLLITCSYQETVKEQTLLKTEAKTEEHLEAQAGEHLESQAGEHLEAQAEEHLEAQAEEHLDAETETETETDSQSMATEELGTEEELNEVTEEETNIKMTEDFPANYFNGNWKMIGYRCPSANKSQETCKCHMIGAAVICIKIIGDYCVTSGHETFRSGNLPAQLRSGQNMSITYVVGTRNNPQSGHWRNSMHIVNQNEFRSQNRRYIRIIPPKPIAPPTPVAPIAPPAPVAPVIIAPAPVAPVIIVPTPVAPVRIPIVIPAQRYVYFYSNYFLGNWNGIGYTCDEHTPSIEVINIKYSGRNLYGTKLLGDNCVPANKLSFQGPIPGKLWINLVFPVSFVIGSPQHPSARQIPNTIRIIDINTFEIGKHTYYRVMGPNAAHPHGVYLNMTPLVGKGGYPGPGYIKMNPKRNMRSPVRRFVIVEEETNKPGNC